MVQMSRKRKIAFVVYFLSAPLLEGLIYLFSTEFLPYHQESIGVALSDLSPNFQVLFLAFLKATGAGMVCVGIAMLIILFIPFRRGDSWARWAISAIGILYYLLATYISLMVLLKTPGKPPWFINVFGIILLVLAFFLAAEKPKGIDIAKASEG
jgi:hypothetical protein